MKKIYALLAIMILLFAACQPTPEEEIVVNKNDGKLEQAIKNTDVPEENSDIHAQNKWMQNVQNSDGGLFIRISAEICIPQAESFPVIRIQPIGFTQEQTDRVLRYFAEGKTLYSDDMPMSKEEITQMILELELEYAKFENGDEGFEDATSAVDIRQMISDFKSKLSEALNKSEYETDDTSLFTNPITMREGVALKIDMGETGFARFGAVNPSVNDFSSHVTFSAGDRYQCQNELYGKDAQGQQTTLDKARQKAQKTMEDLGFTDFHVKDVMTGCMPNDNEKQGYIAVCTPVISGVPVVYSDMAKVDDPNIIEASDGSGRLVYADSGETVEYVPRRLDECSLEININDTGISYFLWKNTYEILSVENENVEILDFEEIKRIFIQQMENNFIYDNHENGIVYTVDRVELGLVNIPQRDKPGYFYLVPAWTFYGDCERSESAQAEYITGEHTKYSSHLSINAIDGSLITN